MKRLVLFLSLFLGAVASAERESYRPTILAPVTTAGTVLFGDGTAAAPSLSFSDDTNTGIYRSGADQISISTGGSERVQITSSQIILPSGPNGTFPGIGFSGQTNTGFFRSSNYVFFVTQGTIHGGFGLDNIISGGGEQSSPTRAGTFRAPNAAGNNIAGADLNIIAGRSTGSAAGGILSFQTSPAGIAGTTSNVPVERMRIASGGNVGIGTSVPSTILDVHGTGTQQIRLVGGAGDMRIQSDPTYGGIGTYVNHPILFRTNSLIRMVLTNNGALVLGGNMTETAPQATTLKSSDASGTNIAGPNLTVGAGAGTGTGAGGALIFQTAAAGSTGSTLNTAVQRLEITGAGSINVASGATLNATSGTFRLPNGAALPATCTVGDMYHDTDSNDCANTAGGDGALCICKAANTWALISNF